jgi:hypothetical protein
LDDLISKAKKDDGLSNKRESKAWISTNEWHQTILEQINFKNKRVLGITGSADFMLSSINKGAREFVGVDISLLSCFFAELKTIGLKNLSYSEFMNFFMLEEPEDPYAFSKATYKAKLRDDISPVARAFFDKVIGSTYRETLPGNIRATIPLVYAFFKIPVGSYALQSDISYLSSPTHFYEAKKQLANAGISLVKGGLLEKISSEDEVKGKFDIIYTSNIHDYSDLEPSAIMDLVHQRLNPGGKIIFFPFSKPKDEISEELASSGFEVKEYYPIDVPSSVLMPIGYAAWKKN